MPSQRTRSTYLALLVLCKAASTNAFKRFHKWFPHSEESFANASANACNATLRAFEDNYNSYGSKAWIDLGIKLDRPIYQLCKDHETCILENVSEAVKASMSTSGVVMGVLPTLLAVLSPSLTEVALLAAQRPLLASLISLGSPGLLQTRIFEYSDPSELLDLPEDPKNGKMIRVQLALGPWPKGAFSIFVSTAEYVLVVAAVVNTLDLAVRLSHRAILTWGCTRTWPTIIWAIVPLVIQSIASLGYRLTLDHSGRSQSRYPPSEGSGDSKNDMSLTTVSRTHSFFSRSETSDIKNPSRAAVAPSLDASTVQRSHDAPPVPFMKRLVYWPSRELTPCACHPPALPSRVTNFLPHPSTRVTVGVLLFCIGGFLAFFHLLYGTVTFSGLLFIDTLDAIGQIAMRFLASALICRFVTLVEIAGMRGALLADAQRASNAK